MKRITPMSRSIRLFTAPVVAGLMLCSTASAKKEVEVTREIEMTGAATQGVEILTFMGDIEVQGNEAATEVKAIARLTAKFPTREKAEEMLGRIQLHVEPSKNAPGVLDVIAKFDTQDMRDGHCSVDWIIVMPAALRAGADTGMGDIEAQNLRAGADLETGMGDIEARAIAGGVEAESGMGDIEVKDVTGPILAKSGMGDVFVALTGSAEGGATAETGMGDAEVVLSAGFQGSIEATTGMGDVDIELAGMPFTNVHKSEQSFRARAGESNTSVKASSGMGSVTISRTGKVD